MISKKKLNEKVHLLRDLERQASDLDIQIEHLKDELKKEMETRGVSELKGDDWKVTWNSFTSSRFDQSGFKVMYPGLYEQFKVDTECRRFSVR